MATGEDVEVKFHASIDRVIRGNKLSAHRNCRPGRDLFLRSRPFQNGRYPTFDCSRGISDGTRCRACSASLRRGQVHAPRARRSRMALHRGINALYDELPGRFL
jgi:hypothetical protein